MTSVTGRIKQIKQPRGGYIKPKEFNVTVLDDDTKLNPVGNIHSSLVGTVVDYMTLYLNGASIMDAFMISIKGTCILF